MKNVSIILRQGDNEMIFSNVIQSEKINEISGTLANRIINVKSKAKNFNLDFGINFSQKFNIEFKVEDVELFKTNVTINNEILFSKFVNEMIIDLLTNI